jgi:HK97 gp10 family phage protein
MEDAEKAATASVSRALVADIKAHTPVITGIAKSSVFADIAITLRTPRGGTSRDVQAGGGPAFYWQWLEFGNSRQKANPIIRTATARATGYMPKMVARHVAIELVKATRG